MSTSMMKNKQWFDENITDVDFITAHEDLTPRGPIHTPISSAEILTKFRAKAQALGLRLVNEKGALKRDGLRFMYLADVQDDLHPVFREDGLDLPELVRILTCKYDFHAITCFQLGIRD